ncbi:MAG: 30S ribosomal protein S6 [Bowdeniella nasicola]|nr:30S ribosomal protein S6 [Bowdeniella nasicola]
MRTYELMIIIDPEVDERTVGETLEKFLQPIQEDEGSSVEVDIWGKRRLAYEINKRFEGIYVVLNLTTSPQAAQELNRKLGLAEFVMRTKLIRPDAK